jgi:hypothetical protein
LKTRVNALMASLKTRVNALMASLKTRVNALMALRSIRGTLRAGQPEFPSQAP